MRSGLTKYLAVYRNCFVPNTYVNKNSPKVALFFQSLASHRIKSLKQCFFFFIAKCKDRQAKLCGSQGENEANKSKQNSPFKKLDNLHT